MNKVSKEILVLILVFVILLGAFSANGYLVQARRGHDMTYTCYTLNGDTVIYQNRYHRDNVFFGNWIAADGSYYQDTYISHATCIREYGG